MRIAISSDGRELESTVSAVFGRCSHFLIVDIQERKIKGFEAVQNNTSGQKGSIGISAAQIVAEKGIDGVITGNIGPRALDVMKQFKIPVFLGKGIVKDTINDFISKNMKEFGG